MCNSGQSHNFACVFSNVEKSVTKDTHVWTSVSLYVIVQGLYSIGIVLIFGADTHLLHTVSSSLFVSLERGRVVTRTGTHSSVD